MTGRLDPGRSDPRDTLLLYCPYDRRVTRHGRRGQDQAVVCLECGRPVDSGERESGEAQPEVSDQRTARFTPVVEPPPARRSQARPRPRRDRSSGWLPLAVVAVALVVGAFAAVSVARNLAAPVDTLAVTASPRPAATASGAPAGEPPPPAQATQGGPAQATPGVSEGQFVRVGNTGGQGAFLRRTTNLDDRLRPWPDNTRLRVLGPDTTVNGTVWRQVEDPAGNRGWIPAEFTRPE